MATLITNEGQKVHLMALTTMLANLEDTLALFFQRRHGVMVSNKGGNVFFFFCLLLPLARYK